MNASADEDPIMNAAVQWHLQLAEGSDEVWDAFVEWLAQDSRHAKAYDIVEARASLVDEAMAEIPDFACDQAISSPVSHAYWSRWAAVIAILITGLASFYLFWPAQPQGAFTIATAAGERRLVKLDDGSSITLNGSTRLIGYRSDPRLIRLETGQALFRVRHDAKHPFRVAIGNEQVEDLGTIFEVVREAAEIRVYVAEGAVSFTTKGGMSKVLQPGQALVASDGKTEDPVIIDVERSSIAGWENGKFTYVETPLRQVASDLSRFFGMPISVDPSIQNRPFSGSLSFATTERSQLKHLDIALDVDIRTDGPSWTFMPRLYDQR